MNLTISNLNDKIEVNIKVRCIATRGSDLPDYFFNSGNFAFPTTDFSLIVGEIYIVYGMSLYKHVINYLIFPKDHPYPDFFPAPLFVIVDSKIPCDWRFQYFGYKDEDGNNVPLGALWGYEEMITRENNFKHYEGLLEREAEEMKIFLKRKKEMDEAI